MQESVLNLGEKIVLASRLAAIEHVRQAISEQGSRAQRLRLVGDESTGSTDGSQPQLLLFIQQRWGEFYRRARTRGAA
jgi:hypothetical protein